jgi:hypothetical protein
MRLIGVLEGRVDHPRVRGGASGENEKELLPACSRSERVVKSVARQKGGAAAP